MALFNGLSDKPVVMTAGKEVKGIKLLKKMLKKGFKGLEKDDAGLFVRKESCDADEGKGKTAKYLVRIDENTQTMFSDCCYVSFLLQTARSTTLA